jgi:uncharacterized protein YecE (DUF72 family)
MSLAESPPAAAPAYIRLHGRNRKSWFAENAGRDERYNYLYKPAERSTWIEWLQQLVRRKPTAHNIYLIANNHFRGQAVVDALLLQKLWTGKKPPLPASLKQAYRKDLETFPTSPGGRRSSRKPDEPPPTLF